MVRRNKNKERKGEECMKSILKFSKVWMLALLCVLFLGIGIKSEAAPGTVNGVKQTRYGVNAVEVSWSDTSGANKYLVELCDNKQFTGTSLKKQETTNNPYLFENLAAGTTYYVRVSAIGPDGTGMPSAVIEVVTAPIEKVTNLKQTKAEKKKVTFTWKPVSTANAYYVVYGKNTNSVKEKLTTKPTFTISGSADTTYLVYVYPVRKSGSFEAVGPNSSDRLLASTLPKKITSVKMRPGKGVNIGNSTMYFSWGGSNAADGYEYQIYGYNNKKLLSKTTSSNSLRLTSSKLKSQFVKIKVRAYFKMGKTKKVGAWSDWVWVAKGPAKTNAKLVGRYASEGFRLSWSKVKGANTYDVYVSRSARSGYKKVATVKGTNCTVTKFKGASITLGDYYYYIVAKKKVGKKIIKSDYVYDGFTIH